MSQGLIERMFKLASLKVFTAGGESSDLVIPGLQPEEARRLKAYVLKKSELAEEGQEGTDFLDTYQTSTSNPSINEELQQAKGEHEDNLVDGEEEDNG